MTATSIEPVRKLEVKNAVELAQFYGIPQSLANMFFIEFDGTLYPKEPLLLREGHRKGIQRIEVDPPRQDNGEWKTEARIYPKVTPQMIEAISKLPEAERKEAWAYLTAPVRESGRASSKNVRMSTMLEWLPEIAIKRAVCRALRLFAGIGQTSAEELPEVVVEKKDLEESWGRVIQDEESSKPPLPAPPATKQPTLQSAENTPTGKPSLAKQVPGQQVWRDTT